VLGHNSARDLKRRIGVGEELHPIGREKDGFLLWAQGYPDEDFFSLGGGGEKEGREEEGGKFKRVWCCGGLCLAMGGRESNRTYEPSQLGRMKPSWTRFAIPQRHPWAKLPGFKRGIG